MPASPLSEQPRRYAVVGTGSRAGMYVDAMLGPHQDVGVPVAFCDTNSIRMGYYDDQLAAAGLTATHYPPDRFDDLLRDERPDVVVVTSPDATHARYVVAALDAGIDVVCEKPLTVDVEGMKAIETAARASSARLIVTFNYRYSPRNTALRQIVADGTIGEVVSVHFEWLLDTVHGADYFRRWHRDKATSGGLAVHKATHHFDLVNWWIDDVPARVTAIGGLRFYGDHGAGRTDDDDPRDLFGIDLAADERMKRLYQDATPADGYVRDRGVFDTDIDIEDTLNLLVGYRSGVAMTYALTAHSPWEGYRVSINGTKGRAELEVVERSHVDPGGAAQLLGPDGKRRPVVDPSLEHDATGAGSPSDARPYGARLVVQEQWGVAREVPIPEGDGAHGGGDRLLLHDVFVGTRPDPFGCRAGYLDGLRSVVVGVAANRSLSTGQTVDVADLGLDLDPAPDEHAQPAADREPVAAGSSTTTNGAAR